MIVQSPGDDDFPMQLVLGYLGLINGVALSPVILIMVRTFFYEIKLFIL